MSETESEEFESADEDFDEKKTKHSAEENVGKPKEHEDDSKKFKSAEENNVKDAKIKEIPIESKTEKIDISEDSENRDKNSEPEDDNKEADGWDFEDWGDEEDKSNADQCKEQKTIEKTHGGWNDFDDDDWGETNQSPKIENIGDSGGKNSPILKEDSSIKSNLQAIQSKSTKPISTYDAFPILNDLSPTKSKVKLPPELETKSEQKDTVRKDIETSSSATAASSSWGWSTWGGVASLLSTATEGVTSLTTQVSQGLSGVIGAPDPAELARLNKNKVNSTPEEEKEMTQEDTLLPSLGNIVTGVTSIGNKVITGGLDTLEGIGKKTMTILQENDPLLLNKRRLLGLEQDKPVLSQVLREAKEKSEQIEKNLKEIQKKSYRKQLHFESLFDHYYGLVHLEALEMLSKQSTMKLQSLLEPLAGKALTELQETLSEVKELCELTCDIENEEVDGLYTHEDLSNKLETAVEDLGVKMDFPEIINCWKDSTDWLSSNKDCKAQDVYEKGLRCLAETCAHGIHKYHKIAELLLIKDHHSTANEADSLIQLTTVLCLHLKAIACRFGTRLNEFEQTEEVKSFFTSIFVEVYNSTSYVQNAFQLFIPILQLGAA